MQTSKPSQHQSDNTSAPKPHRAAVVLLSGGIDSTTCLYHARNESDLAHGRNSGKAYQGIFAVSIDYGQRHIKEAEYAANSCRNLGVPHMVLKAPVFPNSMLTDPSVAVPDISYDDIKGVSPTYVPFRNGTMLSLLTAFTTGVVGDPTNQFNCADIFFGAHAEDAANWAYPDCTPEFIGAMANAIYIGTYHKIRLVTPLEWMTKKDIIKHGAELGVDWESTWSCYKGLEKQCGTCPTCLSRRLGFMLAKVPDPTDYGSKAMERQPFSKPPLSPAPNMQMPQS